MFLKSAVRTRLALPRRFLPCLWKCSRFKSCTTGCRFSGGVVLGTPKLCQIGSRYVHFRFQKDVNFWMLQNAIAMQLSRSSQGPKWGPKTVIHGGTHRKKFGLASAYPIFLDFWTPRGPPIPQIGPPKPFPDHSLEALCVFLFMVAHL